MHILVSGVHGRPNVSLVDNLLSRDSDVDVLLDGSLRDFSRLVDFRFDELFSDDLSLDQRSLNDLSLDDWSSDDSLQDLRSAISLFGDNWFAPSSGSYNRFRNVR